LYVRVIPILLLIARSKLVPDFALTIHLLHLIITTLYTHAIPTRLAWWLLQACSAVLMVGLGVWVCRWRELQPLVFGTKKSNAAEVVTARGGSEAASMEEGEGEGYAMGRSARSGRDGAGGYEMVGMAPREAA